MKKGETRQLSDYDRLQQFAKLVFAMRRAQKRYEVYDLYDKPEQRAAAKKAADAYNASVDYMIEQVLTK